MSSDEHGRWRPDSCNHGWSTIEGGSHRCIVSTTSPHPCYCSCGGRDFELWDKIKTARTPTPRRLRFGTGPNIA